eukprot:6206143-Pleurochrysis_carterae.AAC.2
MLGQGHRMRGKYRSSCKHIGDTLLLLSLGGLFIFFTPTQRSQDTCVAFAPIRPGGQAYLSSIVMQVLAATMRFAPQFDESDGTAGMGQKVRTETVLCPSTYSTATGRANALSNHSFRAPVHPCACAPSLRPYSHEQMRAQA